MDPRFARLLEQADVDGDELEQALTRLLAHLEARA